MKQLEFETQINATPEKVWETLFSEETYPKWTPGHRFEGNWQVGTMMKFFDKDNNGMYDEVLTNNPQKEMKVKHLGWIYDGEISPQGWEDVTVSYLLEPNENGTTLKSEVNSLDEFVDFYNGYFPSIFQKIKEISEE